MKFDGSSLSRRGLFRLVFVSAFLLAGIIAAPIGARAVGDVVIDSSGFVSGQTAVVSDGPLSLRSGPGTDYSVIEVLAAGDYVEIVSGPTSANGYKWYEVVVDGTGSDGYVAGVFLTEVSGGGFSIGDTVYVTSETLNVRSGPGTGYSVIDTMVYGQNGYIVDGPVSADGYTWYELNYVGGSADGWVAGDFLGLVSTGGSFTIGDTVYVNSVTLNVRSGAGTGYTITDVLVYGDQATILDGPYASDGYSWYQISYAGGAYTGWVAGDYLSYYSSGGAFSIGDIVYVNSVSLNVRSGAGTGYTITDVLGYGDQATILDGPYAANGYDWYQISYAGGAYTGWVAGDFLSLYSSGGFYIGQSVYVTGATLNVRSGAGTGYSVVDSIGYGTTATIVDGPYVADGYTWYEIEYDDPLYGWVAGEYLAAN